MSRLLNEAEFKAVTIDWMYARNLLIEDAVLINELPVNGFLRRVDLAVANGKLHAFEIKSDLDSVDRLTGQVETYRDFFDKVTVVCSKKIVSYSLKWLPEDVSIVELSTSAKGLAKLTIKRRGKIKEVTDCRSYLSFLDKKSLIRGLRKAGLSCGISENREQLIQLYSKLPKSYWRRLVLDFLKDRYRESFTLFDKYRCSKTIPQDIEFLSRNRMLEEALELRPKHNGEIKCSSNSFQIDNSENETMDITSRLNRLGICPPTEVKVIRRRAN